MDNDIGTAIDLLDERLQALEQAFEEATNRLTTLILILVEHPEVRKIVEEAFAKVEEQLDEVEADGVS